MPREPRLARRPRPAVKLSLESVEDRIVPSTASMNPLATVAVASPPAVPSVAAVASFVVSTMDQVMTAEQQEVSSAVEIIRQVLTQEEAFIIQEVDSLFGIPTSPNPTFSTTARQSGSGTGSASGATTNPTPSVSSGSGSGSSATPTRPIVPKHGGTKAPSLKSGSGIGFDAGPGSGGGTGTIDGQVWLDNNGDGDLDDGEEGLPGITVWYCTPTGQQIASTTTDTNGDYQFTVSAGNQEEIEVIFPTYDEATIEDPESQIDSDGFSNVFTVGVGGDVNIPAGMRSMHVTTNADDPNAAIPKQITLRDAIETGNNGGGPEVTFAQNVTGSISLQAALPAIAASYDIVGPGASTLTVAGKANALNAYSIFTVNPSVTSKISGLTITGGYNLNGGGVNNSGDVTLYADKIVINNAAAYGGGVINGKSGILTVEGSDIYLNNVRGPGGGIANFGVAIISNGSQIFANNALSGGVGGWGHLQCEWWEHAHLWRHPDLRQYGGLLGWWSL